MNFIKKMRILKEKEIGFRADKVSIEKLKRSVRKARHGFAQAITRQADNGKRPLLIAEFKRASPSRGIINKNALLKDFVKLYDEHADAVSVLADGNYFGGKPVDLREARKYTAKPLLLKDFVVSEYQVYEARFFGADAILLIAGLLDAEDIDNFLKTAHTLGMDCLVECYNENGLREVMKTKARIVGVNNRNLETLKEDKGKAARLVRKIPRALGKKLVIVAESSVESGAEVEGLTGSVDAVLVGTSIMSAHNPKAKLKELAGRTLVKICGVTSVKDAMLAVKYGADAIGLNFYRKSPRFVSIAVARRISKAVRGRAIVCGVFVNEKRKRVNYQPLKGLASQALQKRGLVVRSHQETRERLRCRSHSNSSPPLKRRAYPAKGGMTVVLPKRNSGLLRRRVKRIADSLGLDLLQFSGNEKPADLKGFDLGIIKAIHIKDRNSLSVAKKFDAEMIMVDAFKKGLFGGTGKQVDRRLVDTKFLSGKKLVFSGGLNTGNVIDIIKEFRPFMVDVCSGVEKYQGVKDAEKIRDFVKAVGGAGCG